MQTDPIRWVCGSCLKVEMRSLTAYKHWTGPGRTSPAVITLYLPQCHGRDMLVAGMPKRNRRTGEMIDPVDNLRPRTAA